MLLRQRFITPEGKPHRRWEEAFGKVEVATSASAAGTRFDGLILWISAALPDWEEVVRRLAAAGARIVVLSTTPTVNQGSHAIAAGARGYVHTFATPELLRRIAAAVEAGGMWLGPELMRRLVVASGRIAALQNGHGTPTQPPEERGLLLAGLTAREREVALAVSDGKTNKEIARDLGIVERTVKAHLASVFEKLEVHDRLHLALRLAAAEDDDRLPF